MEHLGIYQKMVKNYYDIIVLKRDKDIHLNLAENKIIVDLRNYKGLVRVRNDDQFLKSIDVNNFFWLSGGGSYLINNRYLLVVKRSEFVKVNPGYLSLLTGRSDNEIEHFNPSNVMRELFEEAIVFEKEIQLYWVNHNCQKVIDSVLCSQILHEKFIKKQIDKLDFDEWSLTIKTDNRDQIIKGFFHINSNNDINLLSVYTFETDNIKDLTFIDGEYTNHDKRRNFFLVDLIKDKVISLDGSEDYLSFPMTEHLLALLINLKKRILC